MISLSGTFIFEVVLLGISVDANITSKHYCFVSNFYQLEGIQNVCSHIVIGNITFPDGRVFELDLKSGSAVSFTGTLTFGYTPQSDAFLLTIRGENITVEGTPGSLIDGKGLLYWDSKGASGSPKPYFMKIETTGHSVFRNINLLNCPKNCVKILSSDLTITGWNIDCSAGNKNNLGKNTDGFDINSGTNIIIEDSIVKNQDDCVAVNQGSNMIISNLHCSGGHGLSLSVGFNETSFVANTVSNVTFSNCQVIDSRNGIHVKTHADSGLGQISKVTYENITMSGITNYGVNIQQDYVNGSSTGKPKDNIPIYNLSLKNVYGEVDIKAIPVKILCGPKGCSSWTWSEVSFEGSSEKSQCNYEPSGYSCR